jgi:glutamate N-acetyltransferase/amino-acid N-acetyltransferase
MIVKGFRASAVASGMRYTGRLDLGLIVADNVVARAGVFTKNLCQAAPVIWSQRLLAEKKGQAILVNAGQANAQTGNAGLEDCYRSAISLGKALRQNSEQILLASTGIIGQRLNLKAMDKAIPVLVKGLSPNNLEAFSQAIITTDTKQKISFIGEGGEVGKHNYRIWGTVKGSGMIAPNMATMLCFVITDANVSEPFLRRAWREVTDATFNRLTVDGDTSTNDCAIVLASGAAGGPRITGGEAAEDFKLAMFGVLNDLAEQIVADGEGATRVVRIEVKGAKTNAEAKKAAKTVAESPLVKTAIHGADANWGRIMAALGRSGASFDPYRVNIHIDDLLWVENGMDTGHDKEASEAIRAKKYDLIINLKAGIGEAHMLTCDFSKEYVEINGSYRS